MKSLFHIVLLCLFFSIAHFSLNGQIYFLDSTYHMWGNDLVGDQTEAVKYKYNDDFKLSQNINYRDNINYNYKYLDNYDFEIFYYSNTSNRVYRKQTFRFDVDSFLLEESTYSVSQDSSLVIKDNKVYSKDSKGRVSQIINHSDYQDVTGQPSNYHFNYKQTFEYNENDQIIADIKEHLYNDTVAFYRIFNDDGLLIETRSSSYEGIGIGHYTYDEQNRVSTIYRRWESDFFNELSCDSVYYSYNNNVKHKIVKDAPWGCSTYTFDYWEEEFNSNSPLLEFDSIRRGEIDLNGMESMTKYWQYFSIDSSDIMNGNYSFHRDGYFMENDEFKQGSQYVEYYTSQPTIENNIFDLTPIISEPDPENASEKIEIIPNPLEQNTVFTVNFVGPVDEYYIYDEMGLLVLKMPITSFNNEFMIFPENLLPGKYILQLFFEGESVSESKIFIIY